MSPFKRETDINLSIELKLLACKEMAENSFEAVTIGNEKQ